MNVSRVASAFAIVSLGLGSLLLAPSPAAAQFTAQWQAPLGGGPAVLSSVAYDDKHDVYLHVWDAGNAAIGRFVGPTGSVLGAPFVIGTHKATFSGFPHVAYSRDTGDDVFLVIYFSDFNGANIFGQRVRYTGAGTTAGTLVGNYISISPFSDSSSCGNKPNDVVYNPASSRFLVSYEEWTSKAGCAFGGSGYDVMVREFGADGLPLSNEINVVAAGGDQGFSALAVDWQRNRYLVAFGGDNPTHPTGTDWGLYAKTLDGTTAQPVSGLITLRAGFNNEPAITYLPERDGFLVSFTSVTNQYNVLGQFVPSATTGSLADPAFLAISTSGNNGGSTVDYDYVSRTVLLAAMSDPKYIRGVILNGTATPQTGAFVLNTGPAPVSGSFYPTVRRAENGFYAVSYVVDYLSARLDGVQLPPAGSPGPHFGGSTVQMAIDSPGNGAYLRDTDAFSISGWAIDKGATGGTGIDSVHVWAIPTVGTPIFVGVINSFFPRGDIGSLLGASFTNSGFSLTVAGLPAGTYTLALYPHSSVSNDFSAPHTISVTIASAQPLMSLDSPTNGAVLPTTFAIAGWAIDKFAYNGTGVDAVHVWAFPSTGGQIFVGSADLGGSRPDVAGLFGGQYYGAGFSLLGSLPPGSYTLVVFMHDALTGTFSLSRSVSVTVGGAAMSVDSPTAGFVALGSVVGGWAIDRMASGGTGVDAVHVWALPVSGGSPVFVGAAAVGFFRPDIGAAFGAQFATAGYGLLLTGLVPGQQYDLAVFAHSSVTGTFNQARVVRVTVQ